MTNAELARLLRSAASALEHGRLYTATIKLHNIMAELHAQFDEESDCNCGADQTDECQHFSWCNANHPDTDEHRAGCGQCQYIYDSNLPNP